MNKFIYDDNVELDEEDIEHLIIEDLDEYIRLAPVHNGKKFLSERAWDALWNNLFGEYEKKSIMSVSEYDEYAKLTREFGDKYECNY